MRTNIEIDATLIEDVQRECDIKSKKAAIDLGLRTLLRAGRQKSLARLSGSEGSVGDIVWSPASEALFELLGESHDERDAVGYDRRLLGDYQPNVSSMLPPELAHALLQASTAAVAQNSTSDDVGNLFMMDFIWGTPARLRGSRFTRYGARNLLSAKTLVDDRDTRDVLNHWAVHEHLIWYVDGLDLTCDRIRTIQAEHVHGRHPPKVMNSYRQDTIYIPGSQYSPLCDERTLSELMDILIQKASAIEHPIEAAFFLWLHLAYLQPFDTANHRTSRTAMNIPLLKAGLVPITFVHVDRTDYQRAMWGFYEFGDASIAADLFTWAYMQSAQRYAGFHL